MLGGVGVGGGRRIEPGLDEVAGSEVFKIFGAGVGDGLEIGAEEGDGGAFLLEVGFEEFGDLESHGAFFDGLIVADLEPSFFHSGPFASDVTGIDGDVDIGERFCGGCVLPEDFRGSPEGGSLGAELLLSSSCFLLIGGELEEVGWEILAFRGASDLGVFRSYFDS